MHPYLISGVRKHPGNLVMIRVGDKSRPAELALGLGGLRREDVAHLGLATLELAGAGLMKALGCAAVCLQLWHCVPDENCVLDNSSSIYDVSMRFCSISPTPSKMMQSLPLIEVRLGSSLALKFSKRRVYPVKSSVRRG
jgi:hypothetical protein